MLNCVQLQGRIVADPELRRTQSGLATCSVKLAVDRDFKDRDSGERGADFLPVVCWRNTAEFVCRYFTKGQMALVEGRLQTRNYQGKDGRTVYVTEVVAENVYFCGKNPSNQAPVSGEERETEQSNMDEYMRMAREFQARNGGEEKDKLPF